MTPLNEKYSTLTFSHFADAFIQSDLRSARNTKSQEGDKEKD